MARQSYTEGIAVKPLVSGLRVSEIERRHLTGLTAVLWTAASLYKRWFATWAPGELAQVFLVSLKLITY